MTPRDMGVATMYKLAVLLLLTHYKAIKRDYDVV
jgi:hypothetical protein